MVRTRSLYGSSLIWMWRYSIVPAVCLQANRTGRGKLQRRFQDLAIARAARDSVLHRYFDQVPILRLVSPQFLVRTRDQVIAALELWLAKEDAAVGVDCCPKLQLQDEVLWKLLRRSRAGGGADLCLLRVD
jgi:hypothetical protein